MYWVLPLLLSLLPLCSGVWSLKFEVFKLQCSWESTEELVRVVSSHLCFPVVLISWSCLGMCRPDGLDAVSYRPDIDLEASQCSFLTSFLSTLQNRPSGLFPDCCPTPHVLEWLQCLCSVHSPQGGNESLVSLGLSLRGWLSEWVPSSKLLCIFGSFLKSCQY